MNLASLLEGLTTEPIPPLEITGVSCHSKQTRHGDLFVALRGNHLDGHAFLEEASQRGAVACVIENRFRNSVDCPAVHVLDTSAALPTIAARFYGFPASQLRTIGVTGTNGKTTTTYLLKSILEAAGEPAGLVGTIAYQIGDRVVPSTNTTPGTLELTRYLAQMVERRLRWCVTEVSSHALAQDRIAGLTLAAGIFTNLGSDHLDYHKTRDAYARAKQRLFDHLAPAGQAIINRDDAFGRILTESEPLRARSVITYALETSADVTVRNLTCSWDGLEMVLDSPWGSLPIHSKLLGRHNASNIVAAAACLWSLGIAPPAIQCGIEELREVPGRLERVPNELEIHVLIDYAHTADALRLALLSLRELTAGQLFVVFGCGGDRDQTKRPEMGRIASLLADHVILTSDNPRGEDPVDIIHQIKAGFVPGFSRYQIVVDREQAISTALASAKAHDAVLIAGKGHEAYQIFDYITVPFRDRDVVERIFASTSKSLAVS